MIGPYKLRPVAPDVALLTEEARVIDEHGQLHSLEALPPGIRAWCSYDTARSLILAGQGEALCWWGEEIRWRHRRFEAGWKRRPSDVTVIHAPFPETPDGAEDTERALKGLVAWRDWLRSEGASPLSSLGSASWSLLRATLSEDLWWSVGATPPLRQALAGRMELSTQAPGQFGRAFHYDLSAAYACTLGALEYGGRWNELPTPFDPVRFSGPNGRPLFVRARVRIPDLPFGPLVRRPRKLYRGRVRFFMAQMLGSDYPTGCRLQGVWTWEELRAALEAGCVLEQLLGGWVHMGGAHKPFAAWWAAIQRGRKIDHPFGQLLAKMTGNALWGQFCIDAHSGEGRTVTWRSGGKRRERKLVRHGARPPAIDLAETVTGRVRARLFELLSTAEGSLVSAHTDGGWTTRALELGEGWRQDKSATRLQVLTPQALRWWPISGRPPEIVLAGVPARSAASSFERLWTKHESGAA